MAWIRLRITAHSMLQSVVADLAHRDIFVFVAQCDRSLTQRTPSLPTNRRASALNHGAAPERPGSRVLSELRSSMTDLTLSLLMRFLTLPTLA